MCIRDRDNIGNYSFASGFSVKAKGAYATAMGYNNNAMGDYSFSIGGSNQANADYSTAAGSFNHANGYNSFVAGMYNDSILGKQNAVTANTPLFIIGNGDNNDARSNAMVVQKNGNVGIGGSATPASNIHFNNNATTENLLITNNTTGHTNGDGFTIGNNGNVACLLYTSPSPRDRTRSRMPSSA